MLYLECEIRKPDGLRDTDVIAEVKDHVGRREQIQVELGFLVKRGGRHFLPVWGLGENREQNVVEVELPQESASGTNRMWVSPGVVFSSEVQPV